jgi:hypothetical protein
MPDLATKLHSLAYLDGMPLTAHQVVDFIKTAEENNNGN